MTPPVAIDGARLKRLRDGVTMIRAGACVVQVHGSGALQCLQGLLSNDLVQPGDGSMVYTALLTPKGMIVADMWVLRLTAERLFVIADPASGPPILSLFRRSMPARMAQVDDWSDRREALWLCGSRALQSLSTAGVAAPDADSRVLVVGSGEVELLLGRPHTGAPFQAVLIAAPDRLSAAANALAGAGVAAGDPDDLEAARILSGWPRLGAEILEKTLPQEVRYDDIQGLSYTKGCYLGQETVARLHFRGHTNRELRGLIWPGAPDLDDRTVRGIEGNEVGIVGSMLRLPEVTLGLAILRREIGPGDVVSTDGKPARVVSLPFTSLSA